MLILKEISISNSQIFSTFHKAYEWVKYEQGHIFNVIVVYPSPSVSRAFLFITHSCKYTFTNEIMTDVYIWMFVTVVSLLRKEEKNWFFFSNLYLFSLCLLVSKI